jgi:hypothetical protein
VLKRILIGAALVLACSPICFSQGFRVEPSPVSSSLTNPGLISTLQGTISVCAHPANAAPCTNKVSTFTDITLGTSCPTSTQIVLDGTNTCVAQTDTRGNFGFWIQEGTWDYTITVPTGQSFGPFTVSAGGSGVAPSASGGLCFSAPWGDDSFSGVTWGSAKLTVMDGCFDSGLTAAGGTIYISGGTAATATAGQGIWIMGSGDPNFSSPPAGWRKTKSGAVDFIGVGGSILGSNSNFAGRVSVTCGSSADLNHPCVWISSTSNTMSFQNLNFAYPGRAALIGVCSDNTTVNCNTAGLNFYNDNFAVNDVVGNGPTVTLTGNSALWINFNYVGVQGSNDTNPADSDKGAAILLEGRGNAGFNRITFNHLNTQLGGIVAYPGTSANGFIVNSADFESMTGTTSAIRFPSGPGAGFYVLNDISVDDPAGIVNAVENDSTSNDINAGAIVVNGVFGGTIGTMSVINEYPPEVAAKTVSPVREHLNGFLHNRVLGNADFARRAFGLRTALYQNIARTYAGGWNANGTTAVSLVAPSPDGQANGGSYTIAAGAGSVLFYSGNQTYAVGDIIILGGFNSMAGGYAGTNDVFSFTIADAGFKLQDINGQSVKVTAGLTGFKPWILGDGEWQWTYRVAKITDVGSNPVNTKFGGIVINPHTSVFFAPMFLHIATGTVTDNEAAEIGANLAPWPDDAVPGDLTGFRNQDIFVQGHLKQRASSPATNDLGGTSVCSGSTKAITFTHAFASTPVIVVSDQTAAGGARVSASSNTGFTVTCTGASDTFDFVVVGNPN